MVHFSLALAGIIKADGRVVNSWNRLWASQTNAEGVKRILFIAGTYNAAQFQGTTRPFPLAILADCFISIWICMGVKRWIMDEFTFHCGSVVRFVAWTTRSFYCFLIFMNLTCEIYFHFSILTYVLWLMLY